MEMATQTNDPVWQGLEAALHARIDLLPHQFEPALAILRGFTRYKLVSSTNRMVLSERRESNGLFYAVGPVNPVAMFFVHILRTVSSTLYIGVTQKLDQRIRTHNTGRGAEWIKANRDAHLVYCESHPTLGSAGKREMQLKNWSGAKKEALIAGNFVALKNLSRCKTRS